jgi:hypothetical protein
VKDIAFHITDIAENSLSAGAIRIVVSLKQMDNWLLLRIEDHGCGMSEETLKKVVNPFYTTRTTRKIGLGVPFLIQSAEQTGGHVEIKSEVGVGTVIEARWDTTHIDCPPKGDVATAMMILLTANEGVNVVFETNDLTISTEEISEAVGGLPLGLPEVASAVRELIRG